MFIAGRTWGLVVAGLALVAASAGCQNANNTQKGAGLGAGAGALAGAIIGHQSGNAKAGAAIGALAGGLGGGLVGNNMDVAEQRDAAYRQAAFSDAARRADARAMTNGDVIFMTHNGVSDHVIISTIQSRGGRFHMDPQSIVHLQQSGVSDNVVRVMHRYSVN